MNLMTQTHCTTNLDVAAIIDEQVLWLQVAVEDAVGVAVRDARQQLLHVALQRRRRQFIFTLVCVLSY